MSNADTGRESIENDHVHQDEFPSSHIYGNETQSRNSIEVSLAYRKSVRRTQRENGGCRTLNSCFLPNRLISDTSLAVWPWTFSKASARCDAARVSGLDFCVGAAKSF